MPSHLCLPDLETRKETLPVVVIDRLPARELGADRVLELLQLSKRLACEQVGDLALDGRVRVARLSSTELLQTSRADGGHRLEVQTVAKRRVSQAR